MHTEVLVEAGLWAPMRQTQEKKPNEKPPSFLLGDRKIKGHKFPHEADTSEPINTKNLTSNSREI